LMPAGWLVTVPEPLVVTVSVHCGGLTWSAAAPALGP
jgi:hypothetical protein